MGGCNARNGSRIGYEAATTELPLQLTVKAYPNPVQDAVMVEVLSRVAGVATFEVLGPGVAVAGAGTGRRAQRGRVPAGDFADWDLFDKGRGRAGAEGDGAGE
jgi:hypothetical protein